MPTETILQLLENGKWHNLKELEAKTQLNSCEMKSITNFLAEYNFVKLDETGHNIKVDMPTKRFLNKIQQLENEENL
jgi:hypothetical protein